MSGSKAKRPSKDGRPARPENKDHCKKPLACRGTDAAAGTYLRLESIRWHDIRIMHERSMYTFLGASFDNFGIAPQFIDFQFDVAAKIGGIPFLAELEDFAGNFDTGLVCKHNERDVQRL